MRRGDLIKCRAGYFEPSASPYGLIIEERGIVRFTDDLMTREFTVLFQGTSQPMYEYEMEIVKESGGADT